MEKTELVKNKLRPDEKLVVPPMLLRTLEASGFLRANGSFLAKVGFSETELTEKPFLYWVDPNDVEVATATIEGNQSSCLVAHRTKVGEHFPLQIRVVKNGGESIVLARSLEDAEVINSPEDSEDEASVSGTLHTIARIVEEQNPGIKCSILLVADGRFVRGAGPSLPEEYNAAIDGKAIGPTVGSCGTAIYWNVPVIAEDIQADPLWEPFVELTKKAGVAACWSYPFSSKTGNVLGALAFYSPNPQMPTKEQFESLKAFARMTGLSVERGRAEEALRIKHRRELELEGQLHQANKMESIGMMAGGIAHDFNNILFPIIGMSEMLLEDLPLGSIERDNAEEIYKAGKRGSELIKQILAFSRQSDHKMLPIRIQSILKEVLKLSRSSIPNYVQIIHDIQQNCGMVMADPTQIHQIAMNLITNAYHAVEEIEGNISVTLRQTSIKAPISAEINISPGEYALLSISDNGQGVSDELIDKIFTPYFTTKEKGKGTGLGLSVVYGIVKEHNGTIRVSSEIAKGTIFDVYLPILNKSSCVEDTDKSEELIGGNEVSFLNFGLVQSSAG